MAIRVLGSTRKGNGEIARPFLNVLLKEEVKNGTRASVKKRFLNVPFGVQQVVPVKSGKGSIIQTADFAVFVFKGSALHDDLKEALDHYLEGGESPQFVVIPVDLEGGFEIGIDDEQVLNVKKIGTAYLFDSEAGEQYEPLAETGNPFIVSLKEGNTTDSDPSVPPKQEQKKTPSKKI